MSNEEKNEENGRDRPEEAADEVRDAEGEERSEPILDPEDEVESEALSDEGDPEDGAFAAEEPETVEDDQLAELTAELEAVRAERDEHLESVKRLRAEFENSRKRQERERQRTLETASEGIVKELLPVIDNLDRALEAEGDIREGVRSTRDQLASILGEAGLSPVVSDGEHFDPNVHEAVMGQPSDEHEDGTVIQTFERGYVLNGKPIRPAKVVVARQG